ncbi:MAG: FAD-dependent monooxygenase [Castellaniella sp.]
MKNDSVLICGTGIAGLTMALALARAGQAPALLGPRGRPDPDPGDHYHPRVYAISPSSQALLAELGVWSLMRAARITPVQAMEVVGDADGRVVLDAWHTVQPALAWIVESGELERALQQAVQVYGIAWHEEKFVALQGMRVATDAARSLDFGLLIGADGARSPVRTAAGIRHRCTPYGDAGVVVHLDARRPHQGRALQWFTGDSILALLPLPDTADGPQVSMVWSMPQARARALLDMAPEVQQQWLSSRLQAVTGGCLGTLRMRSRPLAFPLTLEDSDVVAPGVALVGDAAHRVHPLAGQGLNLGLGDVAALRDVLLERPVWRGPGDLRVLARYRRRRAEPVQAMRWATHGLHALFAQPAAPLALARNLGMRWVDASPLAKRWLISGAR